MSRKCVSWGSLIGGETGRGVGALPCKQVHADIVIWCYWPVKPPVYCQIISGINQSIKLSPFMLLSNGVNFFPVRNRPNVASLCQPVVSLNTPMLFEGRSSVVFCAGDQSSTSRPGSSFILFNLYLPRQAYLSFRLWTENIFNRDGERKPPHEWQKLGLDFNILMQYK